MSKQFEQIKVLYNQIINTSVEFRNLINRGDVDEAILRDMHRSQLVEKAAFQKKMVNFTEDEKKILNSLNEQIELLNHENVKLLENIKAGILDELKLTMAKTKIENKYEQSIPESGSICDYTSD